MKDWLQKFAFCFSVGLLLGFPIKSPAFALLGPAQPWMQATNGVNFSANGGGPMCLSNEYRWNVPVVTYGFDQSFINYFGSNGVAAVTSAIQIFNNLPPASQLALTNYPFDSRHLNYEAQSYNLIDLKSQTLATLLNELGLTGPAENTYVLRSWDPSYFTYPSVNNGDWYIDAYGIPVQLELDPYFIDPGADENSMGMSLAYPGNITNFVAGFNYDPQTLQPSDVVNHITYAGRIFIDSSGDNGVSPYSIYPGNSYNAVADYPFGFSPGNFFTGLTYDDVGGLVYLLSTNNVNYETLLPGVAGVGVNANSLVNGAWRPGVDKITFMAQPVDSQSGAFLATTNYFTDQYITNGILRQQTVARIISRPDFLFSAGILGTNVAGTENYTITGTTNWLNNALANGNTNGAGPGVISPPIQITFGKLGQVFLSDEITTEDQATDISQPWASFDESTNAPVIYPAPQTVSTQMIIQLWFQKGLTPGGFAESVQWQPRSVFGSRFEMQTSTNLVNWTALFEVTNTGSLCSYFNQNIASVSRFYRLVPQ